MAEEEDDPHSILGMRAQTVLRGKVKFQKRKPTAKTGGIMCLEGRVKALVELTHDNEEHESDDEYADLGYEKFEYNINQPCSVAKYPKRSTQIG
ncbi:hypothetical protein BGZ79_000940 [Entomortierella chlamydospora]|nr:hypothetical protein BGZ79_000940 [Entomortierella chlamydospora]